MTSLTLTQLRYIVSVDAEGHFSRAAEKCHVSQPSLSSQIQKVESVLDFIIFDRSKSPVKTTDKGAEFVKRAKRILSQVKDLEHFSLYDEKVSGEFSLGVIPTLAPYLLPLFIEKLALKYPGLKLKISEFTTSEIIQRLYSDELDGALLVTPLNNDKIVERNLYKERFYIYPGEKHQFYGRKELSQKEVEEVKDFWLLSDGHCFRNQVLNICSKDHVNSSFKGVQFESGSLETLKNLVKKGSGYTIIPEMAAKDIKNRVIPFISPEPSRQISLIHSRNFLKEKILDAIEKEILLNLPKEVKNLKERRVIPIN